MAATPSSLPAVSPVRRHPRPIRLLIPTPVRQTRPTGGDSPPGSPADSTSVRELLSDFDGGGCDEALSAERLVKLAVLGKGSTSTVWEAVDVDTLRVVAVKEMVICDSKQRAVLEHELRVLHSQLQPLLDPNRQGGRRKGTKLSDRGTGASLEIRSKSRDSNTTSGFCPYMPGYFGSFLSEDGVGYTRASIVLEHLPGGDLGQWVDDRSKRRALWGVMQKPPPEAWLARVCRDILKALRHLHARQCVHRDVKPANVLLGPAGAKLADFGSTVADCEGAGHRMHGTIRFMSPERLNARRCEASSDLWSAGLTLATAALGENPLPYCATEFEAVEHAEAAYKRVEEHPAAAGLSQSLLDFLKEVLVAEPEDRPTLESILRHPFLSLADSAPTDFTVRDGCVDDEGVLGGLGSVHGGHRCDTRGLEVSARRCENQRVTEGTSDGDCPRAREPRRRLLRRLSSAEDVVRQIIVARRARRRFGGNGLPGVGYEVPPMRDLNVIHLAGELSVSVDELQHMLSRTTGDLNEETEHGPRDALSSPDFSSEQSSSGGGSVTGNAPNSRVDEGITSFFRVPARANVPAAPPPAQPNSEANVGGPSAPPIRALLEGWHRVLGEWHRGRPTGGGLGKGSAAVPPSLSTDNSTEPGTTGGLGVGADSGGGIPGTGGWWKTWAPRRRARSPWNASEKASKTEPSATRRQTPTTYCHECETRPPSGQEESVHSVDRGASRAGTARRRRLGLLFSGAGNTGKCGGPGPAWGSPGVLQSPPTQPTTRVISQADRRVVRGESVVQEPPRGVRDGCRVRDVRGKRVIKGPGKRDGVEERKADEAVAGKRVALA